MGEKLMRGGGAVMADELGEGMQCSDHPYRNNPGGICAFCLQEKLGKLVSSSKFSDPFFSIPPPPSSSSSSPPSFPTSDLPAFASSTRISFLSSKHRRRKIKTCSAAPTADANAESFILNRSKSVAQRPRGEITADASDSPRKKSFWSLLTFSSYSSSSSTAIPTSFITKRRSTSSSSSVPANCVSELPKVAKEDEPSAGIDDASPSGSQASSSFGRRVARSRSVGCGSRSFSGDFLERISNGFGDCTLRRVESHREDKQKSSIHRHESEDEEQRIKERIKCGGIFVGLGMATYWLSATAAADACSEAVRLPAARRGGAPHARTKSWGWAFASPMRAFRPGGGGGGGQTTIIAAGNNATGGDRIQRC